MLPTARLALTIVCWTLALVAEVAGLLLLVAEGRRTGRALRRWREVDPADEGLFAKQRQLDTLVDVLTGRPFDRGTAVALLAIGVVVGTVGNLLTL
jgi:hypothetical protein